MHRVPQERSPCMSLTSTKQSFNPPCQWHKHMLPQQPRARQASHALSVHFPHLQALYTSQPKNGGTRTRAKWRAACLPMHTMARFHMEKCCHHMHELAQVEGDVPPQLDPLEMLTTPTPASLPSEPLACTPMHIPQQVLEVIARAKVHGQVSTPTVRVVPTQHTTPRTPCAGGPVAEAIARMASERAALHAVRFVGVSDR